MNIVSVGHIQNNVSGRGGEINISIFEKLSSDKFKLFMTTRFNNVFSFQTHYYNNVSRKALLYNASTWYLG